MPPVKKDEEELDRGDSFDFDELSELEEDDDGEEFASSLEAEEDEDEDEDDESEEADEDEDDSDEEDDEEDPDEDDESDEDDEDEEDPKVSSDDRIPKGRFNQVLKQRDRERERAQWLEEQFENLLSGNLVQKKEKEEEIVKPKYNYREKEKEYIDLVLEGEVDKAIQLRDEINLAREEEIEAKLNSYREDSKQTAVAVQEEEKFNLLVESYESKYKFLDVEDDDYNEEAVDTVNAVTANLVRQGKTKSQAMAIAVKRIAPMYEKPVKTTETDRKKAVSSKRETISRRRNISASKSQPPKVDGRKGTTRDLDTVKISRLNETQFRKLSDREKRILRGD